MTGDLAHYLAARIRCEETITGPATPAQLAAACRRRGVTLLRSARLRWPGYYAPENLEGGPGEPVIALRNDAGPEVVAHELIHHVLTDNCAAGIDYPPGEWGSGSAEEVATRGGRLLTSEEP